MNGSVTLGYVGARASVRWPFGRDDRGTRALSVIVRQDLGRERLIGITGSAFGDIRSDFGVVGGLSVSLLVSIASDLPLPR